MDALSSVSQRTPEPLSRRSTSSGGADGGFAQTFAALSGDDDTKAVAAKPAPKQRQDRADDGKTSPDTGGDAAATTIDPRLLWLPGGLLATDAQPAVTPPQANPLLASTAALVAQTATTPPIIAQPLAAQTSLAQLGSDLGIGKLGQGQLTQIFAVADRLATAQAGKADGALAAQPALASVAPAATTTTAALSPELAALLKDADKATLDDKKTSDTIVPTATMTTEVALQNAVQPTADTRHVPLDLRDDQGLQRMIDRIETLRDDADSRDTRIRLVPDALGAVDVSVRASGDSLHVHFSAENEATRTLLADAQPRLLELADARGVRIAGASVDAGTSGGGGQQAQPQPRQPTAPASVLSVSTTTDSAGDDARLA